ncbi:myb-like protein X isoform X1 [Homalodisca vitripennis]|uniref:myb-like protein X isoform X1 n=1 Tax=Homalodisca vitripennis TaxID=197043 RepID=UPI001EE9B008|nr:myb-like protein X isoform X1 [Homalodisca vitripennis]
MEKASTPRNRLTRSAAKQVNTPKIVDQDEDQNLNEDVKQNVRRTRRKTDTKRKTNGDASVSSPTPVENKMLKSNDEISDGNSLDGYDSENSSVGAKQRNSPKSTNHNTQSPTISRKSLRVRRSITPGPELESSASKKMKRSTSEGKLETLSTPTNRRGIRARSESKDFKLKSSESDNLNSLSGSCTRYVHRNSTLRVIDKIVEANEGEDSSHDDEPLKNLIEGAKSQKMSTVKDNSFEEVSEIIQNFELKDSISSKEVINETLSENTVNKTKFQDSISEEKEIVAKEENKEQNVYHKTTSNSVDIIPDEQLIQKPTVLDTSQIKVNDGIEEEKNSVEEKSNVNASFSEDTVEPTAQNTEKCLDKAVSSVQKEQIVQDHTVLETSNIKVKGDNKDEENSMEETLSISASFSEDSVEPEKAEKSFKTGDVHQDVCKEKMASDIPDEKFDSDSVEIDIIAIDSNSQEVPPNASIETKCSPNKSTISGSLESSVVPQDENCTLSENNNIPPTNQSETSSLDIQNEEVMSDSQKVNTSSRLPTPVKDVQVRDQSTPMSTCHKDNDYTICQLDSIVQDKKEIEKDEDTENGGDVICSGNLDKEESVEIAEVSEECEKEHNKGETFETPAVELEQYSDLADAVIIEESEDSPIEENQEVFEVEEIEPESCNIEIKNPDTVDDIDNNEIIMSDNPKQQTQNLMESKQSEFDEINEVADEIMEVFESEDVTEDKENVNALKLQEQYDSSIHESSIKSAKKNDYQLDSDNVSKNCDEDEDYEGNGSHSEDKHKEEQNFNDDKNQEEDKNYEPCKEDNNLDEDNYDYASGSDILYKGMSEFSDEDGYQMAHKDGSLFNPFNDSNESSSDHRSGSGKYVSSIEEEEEEEEEVGEEEENNENEQNQEDLNPDKKAENCELKDGTSPNVKDGEKLFDNDNPITYDKALAILNKNRVKKIDDEEFFDMFTQELNRVSEESASDSDIAIVDEYIMEPEETSTKPNKKQGNAQGNPKPIQRPTNPMGNQSGPPPGHFYNQQVPPRHHLPTMQRMNVPNPNYQHYNQSMPMRGPAMYNQFPPPNQPMPEPRMFNPQVAPEVNYSSGMFNQHVSLNTQLRYPNAPPLKVRSVNVMNNLQPYDEMNRKYIEEVSRLDINTPREFVENNENVRCAATMTETEENLEKSPPSSIPQSVGKKSVSTPILNLLGLDKQKLKQLKEVLGIDRKSVFQKSPMKPNVSIKSSLEQRKDKCAKKKKRRRRDKKRLLIQSDKALKKSLVKQIIDSDSATYTDTRLKRPSNVQSSDETSSTDQDVYEFTSRQVKDSSSSSSESTVNKTESMDRKINVQDGSVSVTFPKANRKLRRRPKKRRRNENSSETSPIIIVKRNIYKPVVISDTKVGAGRKMTQRKKETKQKPSLVKSNCGTFTVDGVTASSQSSDSEVVSQEESPSVNYYLQELDRIRQDVKSGRNKLSNMFSQHSLSKNVRNARGSGQENVTKKRKVRKKLSICKRFGITALK